MVPEASFTLTEDRASRVSGVGAATAKEKKPKRAGRIVVNFISKGQGVAREMMGKKTRRLDGSQLRLRVLAIFYIFSTAYEYGSFTP